MSFSKPMLPLAGKLALVTGAGIGIGLGTAEEFARQGAAVALHYAHSAKGAIDLSERINAEGGKAIAIQADLSKVDECFRLVDEAAQALGGLDILVNNSGITRSKPLVEMTPEIFDELFAINVRGGYFCAQRATPIIASRGGGSILNMTSVNAYGALPGNSAYAATKSAIIGFTQVWAIELAPLKIRVNAVGPGMVEVPRYYENDPSYSPDDAKWRVPWGRVGKPADVANVAAFLCSDGADFVTGQTIYVDGGTTAKLALPRKTDWIPRPGE